MKKYHAILAAFGAAHFKLTPEGQLEEPNVFMFDDGASPFSHVIAHAERLFDHALKYKYGPEVLYRQQATWAGFQPIAWDKVPEPMRIAFTLFHAATNALAPFIDKAMPIDAQIERQAETRATGFEKGFGEEGEGRGNKIGDDRLPLPAAPNPDAMAGSNISEYAIEPAAIFAHETNREYCQIIGDSSQVSWDEAPNWQKRSAINGVRFAIDNGFPEPSVMHENWMKEKLADGWTYGETKDPEKKQHPCIVPYDQLPEAQRLKDSLFRHAVMHSLGKGDRGADITMIFSYAAAKFAPEPPVQAPPPADQGGEPGTEARPAETSIAELGELKTEQTGGGFAEPVPGPVYDDAGRQIGVYVELAAGGLELQRIAPDGLPYNPEAAAALLAEPDAGGGIDDFKEDLAESRLAERQAPAGNDPGRVVPHHGSGPDDIGTEQPAKPAKGKRHK